MQSLSPFIINFYYGVVAILVTTVLLAFSPFVTGRPIKTFTYSHEQYAYATLTCFLNLLFMTCSTIALQNEKSGFITLMGYTSLVYA